MPITHSARHHRGKKQAVHNRHILACVLGLRVSLGLIKEEERGTGDDNDHVPEHKLSHLRNKTPCLWALSRKTPALASRYTTRLISAIAIVSSCSDDLLGRGGKRTGLDEGDGKADQDQAGGEQHDA
mmetsp:Transcript_51440/g.117015  ORF Transcript_51440/g.117015 Transcript_51440/m.117015 type:complete len:127 (-) Transcript_51440:675-1055(-)